MCSGVDDVAVVACGIEVVAVAFVIVGVAVIVAVVVAAAIVIVVLAGVDVDNVAAADGIVLLAAFCTLTSFVGF